MLTRTRLLVLAIIILAGTSGWLSYVVALSASSRNTVIPPGGGTTPCNWNIFKDSAIEYDAKDCRTGDIGFKNTVPDIGSLLNTLYSNCPAQGGCRIYIESGIYSVSTTASWSIGGGRPDMALTLYGADRNATVLKATGHIDVLDFAGSGLNSLDGPTVRDLSINNGGFTAPNAALYCSLCYGAVFSDLVITAGGGKGVSFSGGEANRLLTSQVNAFANAGIDLNSAEVFVYGNDAFGNAAQAGNGDLQTGGADRSVIISNTLGGGPKSGLFIGSSKYLKVTNNFIYNAGGLTTNTYDALHIEGATSTNITVIGNSIVQDWGNAQANKARYGIGLSNDIGVVYLSGNSVTGPFGTARVGYFNGGQSASVVFKDNNGFNPVGKITNFLLTTTFTPFGTGSTVVASTDYQMVAVDMYITSTGGTGVSIIIKDPSANTVWSPGATLSGYFLARGYKINFGAFSVAPTVTVFGN